MQKPLCCDTCAHAIHTFELRPLVSERENLIRWDRPKAHFLTQRGVFDDQAQTISEIAAIQHIQTTSRHPMKWGVPQNLSPTTWEKFETGGHEFAAFKTSFAGPTGHLFSDFHKKSVQATLDMNEAIERGVAVLGRHFVTLQKIIVQNGKQTQYEDDLYSAQRFGVDMGEIKVTNNCVNPMINNMAKFHNMAFSVP